MSADEADTAELSDSEQSSLNEPLTQTPLTAAEASALIKNISPGSLLSILKGADYLSSLEKAFSGFRIHTDSLKNPVVKGRLTAEMIQNSELAEAIKANNTSAPANPSTSNGAPAVTPIVPNDQAKEKLLRLNQEQDRLRRDLRNANAQLRAALADAQTAKLAHADIEATAARLRGEVESLRSNAEKDSQQLQQILAELEQSRRDNYTIQRRLAESSAKEKKKSAPSISSAHTSNDNLIVDVAERLIARHKTEAVTVVIEEMLRQKPNLVPVRFAKALVNIAAGERAEAIDELKRVFDMQVQTGDLAGATKTMLRSATLTEQPDPRLATTIFAALSKRPTVYAEIALQFQSVRGSGTYAALRAICRSPLREKLFVDAEEPPLNPASELFRSELGERLSVATVIEKIDSGDVAGLRRWRTAFAEADRDLRKEIEELLNTAAGHSAYSRLMSKGDLTGQAIIDASNVARYEMKLMNTSHALLASILAVRRRLWELRYYPVSIIGDANLPHLIDNRSGLMKLVKSDEIHLVATGNVADELIIREAKRNEAIVVTNDYMIDWDKDGDVEKVNFSISMSTGEATLYFN